MTFRLGLLALLLVLAACADANPRTQVMLELDAECGLLADADTIVLRVTGPDGALPPMTLDRSEGRLLPRSVPLLPLGDDASRSFTVEAELRSGTLVLATTRATSGYRAGETLGLPMVFEDACRGVTCADAESCVAGACGTSVRLPATLSSYSESPAICARRGDASVDAGMDASMDSSTDAGADSSTDSGADAGVPRVVAIAAGFLHACAATSSGEVRCWGVNGMHELGDGTTTMRDRPSDPVTSIGSGATALAAGNFHSCALKRSRGLTCWGLNIYGQLGNGVIGSFSGDPPSVVTSIDDATAIALGGTHSCALREGGTVECWGNNDVGQLGLGTVDPTTGVASPSVVSLIRSVTVIALGSQHTCAALTTGEVWCWGSNAHIELGGAPVEVGCGSGTASCSSTPQLVPGLVDVVAVSSGPGLDAAHHTCALHRAGAVSCWGRDARGQLGDGTSGGDAPGAVSVLGIGDATAIAVGDTFSCAIRGEGRVWCWGDNASGQLGQAETVDMSAVPVMLPSLVGVTALAAGDQFACAIMDGAVYCWGANQQGQLGRGGTTPSPVPMPVRNLP